MTARFVTLVLTLVGTASAVGGCKRQPASIVVGSVTVNDAPLAEGFITFAPVDGASKTAGAAISGGKFRAVDLPPGEKFVKVIASEPPQALPGSGAAASLKPSLIIPPTAAGNNEKHLIAPGEQSLDLQIHFATK